MNAPHSRTFREGLYFAFAAYGWWGLVPPIYFTSIDHVPTTEILSHRIVWSVFLLTLLLFATGRLPQFSHCLRRWSLLRLLFLSTILIATNWFVYIYGVVTNQIVQTSLGYFINPLINVLLGMAFFHERLRLLQWLAVGSAACGVLVMTTYAGQLPWIALTLGFSFGMYGMIRKQIPVDGLVALSAEILFLLPLSAGYLIYLLYVGNAHFGYVDRFTDLLLLFGAVVTVAPLLCFGQAARKLPLSTLGFIQYLAPTAQFLVAVFLFNEEMNLVKLLGFICIWIGLAIFSFDSVRFFRRRKMAAKLSDPDAALCFESGKAL